MLRQLAEWRRPLLLNGVIWWLRATRRAPNTGDLLRLRKGWGNLDWSARMEFLQDVANHASTANRAIIECGSGLSTLLLALIADQRGVPVHSLEHDVEWAARVRAVVARHRLSASVHTVPLVDHGDFDWYRLPDELPDRVELLVCDGPPGSTRGGRYGALPLLSDRLEDATVLLDDSSREGEREVLRRWIDEFGGTVDSDDGQVAVFKLPNSTMQK